MKEIQAIETVYNGFRFRSRLEARWAVFFDTADIKYEYEPDGFKSSNGTKYLPDFYLPEMDLYVEVKGHRPGIKREIEKAAAMIQWGGPIKRLLILSDVPNRCEDGGLWHFPILFYDVLSDPESFPVRSGWFYFWGGGGDDGKYPVYGSISNARYYPPYCFNDDGTIRQDGFTPAFSIDCVSDCILRNHYRARPSDAIKALEEKEDADRRARELGFKDDLDWRLSFQEAANGKVFSSLVKARQARFEHGEQPVI